MVYFVEFVTVLARRMKKKSKNLANVIFFS